MEQKMNQKMIELQNENEKKEENKEIEKMIEEIFGLKDKNTKLEKENDELKEKIAKIEAYMKKKKLSVPQRIMPVELLNELFASMPFENAFGLLAKMPNGFLARNVQKMISIIKEALKNNKLIEELCGQKLTISEDGLEAKHSGPNDWNLAQAIFPVASFNLKANNEPLIASYFEIEIMNGSANANITIGFCDEQFPLEDQEIGYWHNTNSIGIFDERGIWIAGTLSESVKAENYFEKGNFVGIGIIRHPNSIMECFATLNGEYLGKDTLPRKFANIELFPAINLYGTDDSIRINFGKKEWQFKEIALAFAPKFWSWMKREAN